MNLPKSLWPIVELAEKKENWRQILYYIKEFSIEYLIEVYEYVDTSYLIVDGEKLLTDNVMVPKNLYNIYANCNKKDKKKVASSINSFMLKDERSLKKNNSLVFT